MQKHVRRSANESKCETVQTKAKTTRWSASKGDNKCEGVQVKANASAMVLTKEDGRIERNRLRGRGYKLLRTDIS